MTKSLIIDLDMCILDTRTVGLHAFDSVIDTYSNSSLNDRIKRGIYSKLWNTSLGDIIDQYDIPADIAEQMRNAYSKLEVPDTVKSFGDEQCLKSINIYKILVTSGYKAYQESKIEKLNIEALFDEIIIDAVDSHEKRKGKQMIFQELLAKNAWQSNEVLVVGDNPDSELRAGKELGMVTVQTLRPTVVKVPGFDHYISSLCDLPKLL